MNWQYSPMMWPSLAAAAVSAGVAFFVWRRRPAPGATALAVLACALCLWSIGGALQAAAVGLPAKLSAWRIHFFGVVLVPACWLVFALRYTGKGSWLTRRRLILLAIEPVLASLASWTNDRHHLFFREVRLETRGSLSVLDLTFEVGFWIHAFYGYAVILMGTILLLWPLLRAPRLYRRQAIVLLVGSSIAVMGDVLVVADWTPAPSIDPVPWAFTLAEAVIAWGLFRFRLLDVVPIARDTLIEELTDGVIVLDTHGRVVDINPAAAKILDCPASRAIGCAIETVAAREPAVAECFHETMPRPAEIGVGEGEGRRHYDLRLSRLYERSGRPTGSFILLRDISERKRAEEQLVLSAFHDSLTGLPNRALFMDRLAFALKRSERRKGFLFAVLFLDLDRFKLVNDSLGHLMGDELLVAVARRLTSSVRQVDTVARLGGDEFVILFEDIRSVDDAREVAQRIHQNLRSSLEVGGREVFTSASIGIVVSNGQYNGRKASELLRDADIALYRAKELGRSCYVLFDGEMHRNAVKALQVETDLRRAVEQQEFELHYQPIVSLEKGALFGFEALVRWRHPRRGLLAPGDFLPVAQETDLIVAIDRWVLREACWQLATWRRSFHGGQALTVSVNLSARQLLAPELVEHTRQLVQQAGIEPVSLVLEITETVVLKDLSASADVLASLKSLGVQLHLDDFGTGYSSLSVLHRLPIDKLKIDRSFVHNLKTNAGMEIVRTIVSLARSLKQGIIAEGVETRSELDRLRALGCGYAQGYFFSRPMDVPTATSWMHAGPDFPDILKESPTVASRKATP